ncbi:uncharacterized protein K02A2.6-like [Macrosteles quadrilineatus]|uniref:uncharacterized protein K02A2.6-like n=1 Tax=Macrosteles quadrilineatus TaxID=74068 RepID=UPI0023E099C8|nr:uncharacterized protein K02A2.6-like [Macrosteles quadrilineatus]
MTSAEIEVRLDSLRSYWKQFEDAQTKIELATEDEEQDDLASYRSETEEMYIVLEAVLRNEKTRHNNTEPTAANPHNKEPSTTSNISFVPYDEEESFRNFIKRFENFLVLKDVNEEKTKLCSLLHALSPKLHERLLDIVAPDDPYKMNYENVVTVLKDHLEPLPSVLTLQHRFVCRVQQPNESIIEFAMELKKLSKDCQFNCDCGKSVTDMLLRMQLVRGLHDHDIKGQLLQKKIVTTFKEALELATSLEASRTESSMMTAHTAPPAVPVLKVVENQTRKWDRYSGNKNAVQATNKDQYSPSRSKFSGLQGRCYRCGDKDHRANTCKFRNEFCNLCNKVGHIAKVCMGGPRKQRIDQLEDREIEKQLDHTTYDSYKLQVNNSDKFIMKIEIEGKPLSMELDTGAALSSISFEDYKRLDINKRMFKSHVQLRTYTGEIIQTKGVVYVRFQYKEKIYFGKLFIIDQDVEPIFGRDWIREVNLEIGDIRMLNQNSSELTQVLDSYSDIFSKEIGCIPNEKGHLNLKEDCGPIFVKPRQVPYAIKQKVEEELDRLEKAGIITKIENSEWGTPIVPVVKPNGSVRICADYKTTLNKVIRDEKYPIQRIEDIFAEMNGGKFFCTLDVSNAYLHMPMDSESALLQTISTQKGLYKVNRLMFGVKVAPALWQRFMDKVLQGTDGVKCFFDDIIIQGTDYKSTLERLKTVLEKLRAHNLKLNFDKCKFFQQRITYLGHTIDENGLKKNSEKVKAIIEAEKPRNVNQLRSFIGMANYYNKFIPRLAEKLYPLNKLLQKGQRFEWSQECENSFINVKKHIANDNTLAHYNPKLPLILSTDASPYGLGAVISHKFPDGSEQPIAFASRSLSKSEKQYSQIDKEATAIYWGVKKFFAYCYGRKFVLQTDHKPLVSIFHPSKCLPAMSATRLLNYSLFLAGFDYTIEYRRTSDHCNADFLSRFPVEQTQDDEDLYSKFQMNQIAILPLTQCTLAEHTKKDSVLATIVTALENGENLEKVGFRNNDLSLHKGCIFRGSRVVIPNTLQKEVLKELHIGHLGMSKMKAMARSYVYWKNLDNDIENLVNNCDKCKQKRNEPSKLNHHPWEEPTAPWHRSHLDFCGPVNGNYFFIIIDAHTKWLEVIHTKNTSSDWCIRNLSHLFPTFGLPVMIVTDNGSQFTSALFQRFLSNNGICHRTCAPFHPSSNGQAERFVQTVKKSLAAMSEDKGDLQHKIDLLVTQLRKAPNSTGLSAYVLMFGRDIRTKLNVMADKVEWNKKTMSEHKLKRNFQVGQRVLVRNYSSKVKWKEGKIISRTGNVMFKVKTDTGLTWTRHSDQILPLH